MKKFFGLAVGVLTFLLLTSVTFADGKYFPQRMVKKTPDIPGQRAVMAYRNGVERLIIESAINGEGQEFSWVIPLPNVPTEFEAVTGGFIEAVSGTVQPKITDRIFASAAVLCLSIIILIWFICWTVYKIERPYHNLLTLLILITIIALFAAIMLPALGHVKGMSVSYGLRHVAGIDVIDVQEVGSYDLSILDAKEAGALNEWLSVNGFAELNEQEEGIISEYIKDGWCFVASKLKRKGEGFSVPHPLSMTFESDKAVYPMKLTGAVGSDVYLELFVVAEETATAENMVLEFCDKFNISEEAKTIYAETEIQLKGFVGQTYNKAAIGHPLIFEVMWDGAYMSRLSGRFLPSQMRDDIAVKFDKARAYRKHYYSKHAAGQLGITLAGAVFIVTLLVCGVKNKKAIFGAGGRYFAFVRILLPTALVTVGVYFAAYVYVDKTEIKSRGSFPVRLLDDFAAREMYYVASLLSVDIDNFDEITKEVIEAEVTTYLEEDRQKNMYTREEIKTGDMPGDYEVIKDDRGVVIRSYLAGGFPVDFVLSDMR